MPFFLDAWASPNTELAIKILVGGGRKQTCIRVHNELQDAMSQGDTILEMASRVQRLLGDDRKYALRIARNVVGAVLSESRFLQHLSTGATHKIWLCSRNPGQQLPGHAEVEARYRDNPCPIDEGFVVNGFRLRFPRDYLSGRPDDCIDCECLAIAKRL